MKNKTYQFKKLTKEVLESLEPKGRYTILFCNGDVKQMVLELNTDGSGVFLDGFARFPISRYEDISVLLPLSKVGEVTDEDIYNASVQDNPQFKGISTHERLIFQRGAKWMRSLLQLQSVKSEGKEAVEFAEWTQKRDFVHVMQKDKSYLWFNPNHPDGITSAQLYQLYLTSKK